MKRVLPLAVIGLLALGACGDDGETVTTPTTVDPGAPGGGGDLFLSIEVGGGFVPIDFAFREFPLVTIYADGTVFQTGAVPAIFPGPAVTPVFTSTIAPEALQSLLDAAAAAGLVGGQVDTGDDRLGIADAPSTTITIVADGVAHTTSVYALDIAGEGFGAEQLSEGQLAARRAIAGFVADAQQAVADAAAGGEAPYTPDRYQVFATAPSTGFDVEPNRLDWPASTQLSLDACKEVAGDDATALTEVIDQATQITLWIQDGEEFSVAIRPLLPHEEACDGS